MCKLGELYVGRRWETAGAGRRRRQFVSRSASTHGQETKCWETLEVDGSSGRKVKFIFGPLELLT